MTTRTATEMIQEEKVLELCNEASADLNDRRQDQRHPFFRPVTVSILELRDMSFEGFCKDISVSGMGIICTAPMPTTKVMLQLEDKFGKPISIKGEVIRTEYCGKGWYSSGIKFCD